MSAYHPANNSIPLERHYVVTNRVERCLLDLFRLRARCESRALFLNVFNDMSNDVQDDK